MERVCKNCRHFMTHVGAVSQVVPMCGRSAKPDLVNGGKRYESCTLERYFGACGEEGKNFEPADKPDLSVVRKEGDKPF